MKFYVAPLEGITGYVYRNVHHKYYPGADKYYIPFIEPKPKSKKIFTGRELKDILPEHNQGLNAVPQILTNKWEDFVWTARHLQDYGYGEVNLNLGCPSRTVVSKGRGAGFLAYPEKMDEFLYHIFEELDMKISVKTRLGKIDAGEFHYLLEIYNQYPLEELIIHPRTQKDFYKGTPDYEAFAEALSGTELPLCYNGDITDIEGFEKLVRRFPKVHCFMMGRGVLRNPALISELKGQDGTDIKTLRAFHDELLENYKLEISGEIHVLYKMKELWCFMGESFAGCEKEKRKLMKAKRLEEYEAAAGSIFENSEF